MSFTLEELRAGDRVAWKEATDDFYGLVWDVLGGRSKRLSEEDLEDIASESIAKVIRVYLPKVLAIEELKRLVIETAKNRYKDWLEKRYTLKRGAGLVESIEDQPVGTEYESSSPTPVQVAEQNELALAVDEAISQLPDNKWQVCLRLRYRDDLSYEEIARATGWTKSDVGISIHRGQKALEPILEKMGLVVRSKAQTPLEIK